MARLPRISRPRIPRPLTSPSAAYGVPQATGSPSGFYGTAPAPAPAPLARPSGGALGAGIGGAAGPQLPRIGGTLGGVPMVRTQQQPDPYAALSEAQLMARARQEISAQIDPLEAQIISGFEGRAKAGSEAIRGITDALAQRLQAYQGSAANIYGQAQQSRAASEAALSSMLSGQGTQLASELGSRLASINAPAATGAAQQAVTQAGAGSAGALYGKGSASLSDLIARGAGAQEYASKLPGIAGLAGVQQLGQFQGQVTGQEADQLGRLRAQIPGLTQNVLSSLRATELQKAGARTQQQQFDVNRSDRLAAGTAANTARVQAAGITARERAAATTQTNQTRLDIANAKSFKLSPNQTIYLPNGKGGYTQFTAPPAPTGATAAKPPKTISTPAGTMQYDPATKTWSTIPGTQPPAKPESVPNTIKTLGVAVSTGGWDPKTNTLSPEVRAGIKDLTGIDPGPTATRAQLVAAGLLPKAAKPGKPQPTLLPSSTSPKSKNLLSPDGKVLGPNPNYTPPGAKPTAKQRINISLSRYAGHWVDAYGDQVKGVTGTPPPPDQATPKLDFTRSRAEHKWVDSNGNPVAGIPGKPPPLRTPSAKNLGEQAKWDATAESFASVMYNGGKDPSGNRIEPQTYTQALQAAQQVGIPFSVLAKHLQKYYAHGNKAVHEFVTDPAVTFTTTGSGRVAAFRNGKLVRYMQKGGPGYSVALQRAKTGQ